MKRFRTLPLLVGFLAMISLALGGCGKTAQTQATQYTPLVRPIALTAVPLLVHEQTGTFGFLKKAFAKGGVLFGKEVWGFAPSSIAAYRGDTLNITLANPGDDPHTFTIDELGIAVSFAGRTATETSFVADRVGVYRFYCAIPEHSPYMSGTLTVLPQP